MPNSYYNHSTYPTPNSPGSSAQLRAELDSITSGFNKLPTLVGNANKFVRVNAAGTLLETIATIPPGSGGTGLTSYAANGALYADPAGTALLSGTLPIASGGTGAITAAVARTNILPSFTGNANKALVVNPGETDVTYSFLDLSAVTGILPIANGGTNAATAPAARANLLPSFVGKAGQALVVNLGETDVQFQPAAGVGTVTSVNIVSSSTDLTVSGSPITAAGTITLSVNLGAKVYFMGQF